MISVIIPLYNKEQIIERTLQSVLSQDYDDFEVVVVNDGSTDGSVDIVRSIDDSRIRLIEQENSGPSKARNTGVIAAKGDWLYFIDADDEMLPGALTRFVQAIELYRDADMIIGEVVMNDGLTKKKSCEYTDSLVVNPYKESFYGRINQCSGSTIYKKELCLKTMYDERLRRFEDLEMLYRRYKRGIMYSMHYPVAQVNVEFASASHGRKDISQDFIGHLDFKGKSFWERMCLYKFYLGERPNYVEQCKKLYPSLSKRYDLLLLYKLLNLFR